MSEIRDLTDSIESLSFREKLHNKYKVKEKIETLPSFEKCLLLLCPKIRNCYNLKDHIKFKFIPCRQFSDLFNSKINIPEKRILDFSRRELSRLIFSIRLLNDYDSRDQQLEEKLTSLRGNRPNTKISIINTNNYKHF